MKGRREEWKERRKYEINQGREEKGKKGRKEERKKGRKDLFVVVEFSDPKSLDFSYLFRLKKIGCDLWGIL